MPQAGSTSSGGRHRAGHAAAAALLAAVALSAVPPVTAAEPTVVRGPYLQAVGSSGGVIAWRTDAPAATWAGWGASPGVWTHEVSDPNPTIDHAVTVTGLAAEEVVYYAVGTPTAMLVGGDIAHRLRAVPAPDSSRPVTLWVIGDSGWVGTDAANVRDAAMAATGEAPVDAWLLLGDNAYMEGTDAQYQAAFFEQYAGVAEGVAAWPAIGNHDSVASDSPTQTGPFFDGFVLPTAGELGGLASGTEAWGSADVGAVHLVRLDTSDSSLAADGPMLTWLAADLAARRGSWLVVYFHHPPYTKGSHDSDDPTDSDGRMTAVRSIVVPLLEGAGADLVLAGHSHAYERSYLLDGHYGDSTTFDAATMRLDAGDGDPAGDGAYHKTVGPHGGAVYAVAGSASRLDVGPFGHPAHRVSLAALGSLLLTATGDRLEARFVDDGGTVRDRFTIVKAGVPFFADGFETGDTAAWDALSPPPPPSSSR